MMVTPWGGRLGKALVAVCLVAAVVLAIVIELRGGGYWGMLLYAPLYVLVLVGHVALQWWSVRRLRTGQLLAALLLGDILLVGGFLAQYDFDDLGQHWFLLSALGSYVAVPPWWPAPGLMNVLAFLPLLGTWLSAAWLAGHGPAGRPAALRTPSRGSAARRA